MTVKSSATRFRFLNEVRRQQPAEMQISTGLRSASVKNVHNGKEKARPYKPGFATR
jgi:hypothetical protein